MADYYHDARKAKRALKEVAEDNKRRREERRAMGVEDDGVEHPWNLLSIDGRGCKLYKSKDQHDAVERQEGLIPWNGDNDNLIDRFDARSLLDFYREPPANAAQKTKTPQEEKLQALLAFESYRDLVRLAAKGLSETEGLHAAAAERLEARAAMRVVATAAFRQQSHLSMPSAESAKPAAGVGMYSNIGFNYGAAAPADDDSSSSSSDDDDDDDGQAEPLRPEEDEHERQDELAEGYGITDFSYRLHRALGDEGEQEAALMARPRRRKGRKKERERARRMAGMGLDPRTGQARNIDWRDPIATNAPSAHLVMPRRRRESPDAREGGRGRSRSASRSRSPPRDGGRTYITEWGGEGGAGGAGAGGAARTALPTIAAGHIDRKAFEREEGMILEALPGLVDPAQSGAQFFPQAQAMQNIVNIRQQQELRRRSRSRSRDRHRRRSRSKSRSRSRDRYRRRSSRSRSRDRHRRRGSRSRSRSSSPRGRGGAKGGPSTPGRTSGSVPAAAGSKPGTASNNPKPGSAAAAAGGPPGETPAERLKRIMAAQINKAATKDSVVATQKKLQAEKERAARAQIERLARRHSPRRGRSRSRSPPGYRRYSRSRSR